MSEQTFATFEEACKHLGIGTELPNVTALPEDMQKSVIAQYKLQILVKAHNDGWKPNYADRDQWKYFPWFRYVPGSGWSCSGFGYGSTSAYVGARLALKSSDLAEYMGETFIDLYRDWLGDGE